MNVKRKQAFSNKLLKALAIGGVVTIAAVNPFFGVIASYVVREELRKMKWKNFNDRLYYLKRRGFVEVDQNPGGSYLVKVTASGRRQIKKYNLDDILIKTPKKWDKQWRMIIFDIPVEKQKSRLALLSKLRELGFIMFQKSIWVHPFECRDEIFVLARAFEVDKHVEYILCKDVSAGEYLREEFEKRRNIKLA